MNELQRISQARQALAEATTVEEVKDVRDKAEAIRQYVKQAGMGLKAQNECAEIKIRAERKGGELLHEMDLHGGDRKSTLHDGRLKLSDMGMNYTQSHRWQLEAFIPDDIFEEYIADIIAKPAELTTASILRLARKLQQVEVEPPPLPEGKYNVIYADPPWRYDFSPTDSRKIENQYPTMPLEAMIWDAILCSPFQVYFAPEKAGGGFEIRLPDAPRSNVNDFWILLIVST